MTPIIPQELKRCTKCGNEYPATTEFFAVENRVKSGLAAMCRHCKNSLSRAYCRAHKGQRRLYHQKRQREHPEINRESLRRWREANRDKVRAQHKRWRIKYHERELEKDRQRGIAYYKLHAAEIKARAKLWAKKHPIERQLQNQRRRAQKRGTQTILTLVEWENILAYYGYQCAYCEKTWADCKLTQDHVIPLSQGGTHTANNVVPACFSCNSRKNKRTPEQTDMRLRLPQP